MPHDHAPRHAVDAPNPVLVEVARGPMIEATHRGAAVIADRTGKVVAHWGDYERLIYPRSAIKPVQAIALVESGAADAFEVSDAERVRLRDQFMAACERADLEGLLSLFTDDIAITSDGGGKAKAALNVVRGADKVARFLLGLVKKAPPGTTWTPARINTEPGMLVHIDGALFASFAFDMADGRIQGIAAVLNPDKLPSEAGVGAA